MGYPFTSMPSWCCCCAAVILAGAAAAGSPGLLPADARPNLLMVTFDTTRADRLSAYGYRYSRTPAIDRLAREGVVFRNAYAPAVQTLPSHVSLFTGLYPITVNVVSNGQRLGPEAVTLAEILRDAGYRTGAIVATAPLMKVFGLAQGFSTYDDNFEESILTRGFKQVMRFFSRHLVNIRTTRPADSVAALAHTWLRNAARDERPFFLWLHFIEPHAPYERRAGFGGAATANGADPVNVNYISEIELADHHLRAVLRALDDLRLTNRTLTVFTADHGESLGEDGYTGHREEVYERIIRVPLVMRLPSRLPAGSQLATPAQLADVMPTVLDLLHVRVPDVRFQGANLLTLPEGEPRKIVSMAAKLFTRNPIRVAMIHGNMKYVYWPDAERRALYDIAADPEESRNLLNSAAVATRPIDWSGELREWWQQNDGLRASDFVLSDEHRERLRSLGYVR